jgi:hypothetical protein
LSNLFLVEGDAVLRTVKIKSGLTQQVLGLPELAV